MLRMLWHCISHCNARPALLHARRGSSASQGIVRPGWCRAGCETRSIWEEVKSSIRYASKSVPSSIESVVSSRDERANNTSGLDRIATLRASTTEKLADERDTALAEPVRLAGSEPCHDGLVTVTELLQ